MSEHDEISAPHPDGRRAARSRKVVIGRVLSALAIAFLLFDAGIKIVGLPVVGETSVQLGWTGDVNFWRGMGVLLLACTALYIWPRTTLVGAILLTGYLGYSATSCSASILESSCGQASGYARPRCAASCCVPTRCGGTVRAFADHRPQSV